MRTNTILVKDLAGARSVMAAWRERRGALLKARKRPGTAVDATLKAEEKRLASRLASVLRRAGKKAAAAARRRLAKAGDNSQLVQRIIDDLEEQGVSAQLVDEMESTLRRVFKEANAKSLASVEVEQSGAMLQHADAAAIKYADARAASLVKDLSKTTRDGLRLLIEDAVGEGKSSSDLSDDIQDSYEFSPARAETIARTELAEAHVSGNIDGWQESGVVSGMGWATGAGCCGDCDEMDGQEVELGQDFDGPDGPIDHAPLHPNCRCDNYPVLAAPADDDE